MSAVSDPGLGQLSILPRELRDMIYKHLLVSTCPRRTWGTLSSIRTDILAVSKVIHAEAAPVLYCGQPTAGGHRIPIFALVYWHMIKASVIPPAVYHKLPTLTLTIVFETLNRGDSLMLYHSPVLEELHIELLNQNQRKRGRKLVRSDEIKAQVRRLLLPFAYLNPCVTIVIEGFDTIEYVELWHEIRSVYQGKDMPIDMMMQELVGG